MLRTPRTSTVLNEGIWAPSNQAEIQRWTFVTLRMLAGDVTSPEKLCWLWCPFNNTVTEQAGKHDILKIFFCGDFGSCGWVCVRKRVTTRTWNSGLFWEGDLLLSKWREGIVGCFQIYLFLSWTEFPFWGANLWNWCWSQQLPPTVCT